MILLFFFAIYLLLYTELKLSFIYIYDSDPLHMNVKYDTTYIAQSDPNLFTIPYTEYLNKSTRQKVRDSAA